MTFWEQVARDVCDAAHQVNPQVPLWNGLDDLGKKSLILICQLTVKSVAKRGKEALR
jgi:hypothetical protein